MLSANVAFCFASSKELLLVKSELVPQPAMNVSTTNDFFGKRLKISKNVFFGSRLFSCAHTLRVFPENCNIGEYFLHVKMSNFIPFSPL